MMQARHSFVNAFYILNGTNYKNQILRKQIIDHDKSMFLPADPEFMPINIKITQ
jgi:hypothetical protein